MSDYVFINGQPRRTDELYHFGVKGMKWGHRKAKYDKRQAEKKQLTPEQKAERNKKLVKAGVAVAGTALAVYGAYKLGKAIKSKNFEIARENGKKASEKFIKDNSMSISIAKFKGGVSEVIERDSSGMTRVATRFANHKSGEDFYAKRLMENSKLLEKSSNVYADHVNKASNDSLLDATKNVAKYYYDKRKRK